MRELLLHSWPLVLIGLLHATQAAKYLAAGQYGLALTIFCYAVSCIGIIMAGGQK